MRPRKLVFLLLALAAACGPSPEAGPEEPEPRPAPGVYAPSQAALDEAAQDFDEMRTGFLEWYFEAHPVRATELGIHLHDTRLPALDRAGVQDRIDDLLDWLANMENIPFDLMRDEDRYDYAVLEYGIRAELLDLEEARSWTADPRLYVDVIARGLGAVAEREYAPVPERVAALVARMRAALGVLEAARSNIRQPPRLWTELAIGETRQLVDYLESELPAELAAQAGAPVAGLEAARSALVEALASHREWLEGDLLPRSTGTYRLGRYLLERKLLYGEHISLSLEELERLNTNAINEYRQKVEEVAREIDPNRTPREILDSIGRLHPAPDELLAAARENAATARDWVLESGVVQVPRAELPTVRSSPPYERDLFYALDGPGPFEQERLETFYDLTTVQPGWSDTLKAEHLSRFSYPELMVAALHDTYPGHYVQQQYEKDLTDLRRVFAPQSFTGGWAHYAAGMALDEGASADPAVRIVQLQRALQRHARWFAVIRIHAMNEPLERVVAGFQEIAYFPEFPARREVIRATYEPTYMADALGRMQILEIRDDYREYLEEHDRPFSLAEFHQKLLRLGLPFPLAREALMPRERERPSR